MTRRTILCATAVLLLPAAAVPAAEPRPPRPTPDPGPRYQVEYSDVTLNLLTVGGQEWLHVRFPFPAEVPGSTYDPSDRAFWTNRPEAVRRTWVSEAANPPAEGTRRWFNIEFDVAAAWSLGSIPYHGRLRCAVILIGPPGLEMPNPTTLTRARRVWSTRRAARKRAFRARWVRRPTAHELAL